MDVAVANEPLLPFGQSYWDYLPDLVQTKILKMAHQQLLKSVHAELWEMTHKRLWKSVHAQLWELFSCPICKQHFDDRERLEYHWSLYFGADEER